MESTYLLQKILNLFSSDVDTFKLKERYFLVVLTSRTKLHELKSQILPLSLSLPIFKLGIGGQRISGPEK